MDHVDKVVLRQYRKFLYLVKHLLFSESFQHGTKAAKEAFVEVLVAWFEPGIEHRAGQQQGLGVLPGYDC